MPGVLTSAIARKPGANMAPKPDIELLRAATESGDREAFNELYHRYERAAYNLALHLTGKPDLAEDALQEAMLRVWKYANTLRRDGNVRAWILRIVARAALEISKRRRRSDSKEGDNSQMDNQPIPMRESRGEALEQEELLTALHKHLGNLSIENRRLVALYFGAGFSQQEISTELELSQTAVSHRLDKILQTLRAQLAAAGFAAAAPLINADGISKAIFAGSDVPEDLGIRVLQGLNQVARYSRRAGAAISTTRTLIWILILFVAGATVAGGYWWASAKTEKPRTAPASIAPQPVVSEPVAKPALLYAKWDFNTGPAKDLYVFQGKWAWKATEGKGAMVIPDAPTKIFTGVLLPQHFPRRPLQITFQVSSQPAKANEGREYLPFGIDAFWLNSKGAAPFTAWIVKRELTTSIQQVRLYLKDDFLLQNLDGFTASVVRFDRPHPGERLAFLILNWSVHSIEVRELSDAEWSRTNLNLSLEAKRISQDPNVVKLSHPESPLDWTQIPESFR